MGQFFAFRNVLLVLDIHPRGMSGNRKRDYEEKQRCSSFVPCDLNTPAMRDPGQARCSATTRDKNSQLQQSQVGVAVECALFALLDNIVLEYCGSLGVVSVQAVEDGIDMRRPRITLVKSDTHFVKSSCAGREKRR